MLPNRPQIPTEKTSRESTPKTEFDDYSSPSLTEAVDSPGSGDETSSSTSVEVLETFRGDEDGEDDDDDDDDDDASASSSMAEISDASSEPANDSSASLCEQIEPKLKYKRLRRDVEAMLRTDAVSCVTVNSKLICLGTCGGKVRVFDHQGNSVDVGHLRCHSAAVNQISVDSACEYIASCSHDGGVYVSSLYGGRCEHQLGLAAEGRPIYSVAIDPLYRNMGVHRRFVVGGERLRLYEKRYLSRGGLKATVLLGSAGVVQNIKWQNEFVACACHDSVRVYDIRNRRMVGVVRFSSSSGPGSGPCNDDQTLPAYPCCLRWQNSFKLLVGWFDHIRVCVVDKCNSVVGAKRSPSYIVNVVASLQLDYCICGISPFDACQVAVLGYPKNSRRLSPGATFVPRLHFFQWRLFRFTELYTDTLAFWSQRRYSRRSYHMDCLAMENRLVIACPADVIVAEMIGDADRIEWMLGCRKYDEAYELAAAKKDALPYSTLVRVAKKYVRHLMETEQYSRAARVCGQMMGADAKLWEAEAFKFARASQLRVLSQYLPSDPDYKLDPRVYEEALYECLKRQPEEFTKMAQQWSPLLCNMITVKNVIRDQIIRNPNLGQILPGLVAVLDLHSRQYDDALNFYIAFESTAVFDFIRKYRLREYVAGKMSRLMDLDAERAVELFLEEERVEPSKVVAELQRNPYKLFLYLDALNTDSKKAAYPYHQQLVKLYAQFCPAKLMPLLRRSRNYSFHQALAICDEYERHNEAIYLQGRMGNCRRALQILVEELADPEQAVNFCVRYNDVDLWGELVELSAAKPDFISHLLPVFLNYVNPIVLISRLDARLEVPGLKRFLEKILENCKTQRRMKKGCRKIIMSESYDMHNHFSAMHRCGYRIDDSMVCGVCNQEVLTPDRPSDTVLFYCRHAFHKECLPLIDGYQICAVCFSKSNNVAAAGY